MVFRKRAKKSQITLNQALIYLSSSIAGFSVTPFKIDQNKDENRSIDKVQNLGNERRYIYKDPRKRYQVRGIVVYETSEEMIYTNL